MMEAEEQQFGCAEDFRGLMCRRCGSQCNHGEDISRQFVAAATFACGGLTRHLTDEQLTELLSEIKTQSMATGTVIIEEGSLNDQIYLLVDGEVSICKEGIDAEAEFEIARLKQGNFFGELSWLDSRPASATVKVVEDCRLVAIPVQMLPAEIRYRLALNIARGVAGRLREQNAAHVASLGREAKELRTRNLFGRFYIVTMVLFGILTVLPIYLQSAQKTGLAQMFNSWVAVLILLIPMVYFLRRARLPASTFGLTFRGSRQALREACIVIILLSGILLVSRWFTKDASEPFFTWGKTQGYTAVTLGIYLALYPVHSFLQELIARGVLQGALQIFLGDIHFLVPSTVVAVLFGIAHMQYGMAIASLTFSVGVLFGVIYYRHKTLVGVTVIHCVMGILAMAVGWI